MIFLCNITNTYFAIIFKCSVLFIIFDLIFFRILPESISPSLNFTCRIQFFYHQVGKCYSTNQLPALPLVYHSSCLSDTSLISPSASLNAEVKRCNYVWQFKEAELALCFVSNNTENRDSVQPNVNHVTNQMVINVIRDLDYKHRTFHT